MPQISKEQRLKRILFILSVIGPGLVTATADNDASGIATYAMVGAMFGYKMLWGLFLITISLAVIQEMAARMGVVTGKGLSDLIREHFGVKMTFFAMITLLIANLTTTIGEFAGIAASLEIFGVSKYISVPLTAIFVWYIINKGSYKKTEKFFLALMVIYISYIISGFLAKPEWKEVFKNTFVPSFSFNSSFILIFIAMIGTTITPWMQFYLQSSVVDKGVDVKNLKYQRWDVFLGAFWTDFIAFFIIVATAATLHKHGIVIETAEDAAKALQPFAGKYASALFAVGLFGASLLGAHILPLSTAYAVTEAFGLENGLNKKMREAPVFYGLILLFIVIGAGVILLPNIPLIKLMIIAQEINGILLPIILIYMLKLTNDKEIMGEYVNSRAFNIIAWITVVFIIILTLILLVEPFLGVLK
ncbi:Nramp family divalent metal transporter [Caldicellulosiruptor sp. DIB 104C]|uniref:Nramp family divalent metal transporter n=1 Tax=Caldicellulosiruptor sp. DIB 104C TaxID=3019889 RepID=UPI0023050BDC|nr:Nramp family divalent metal transporter [Caldicellulosiruptor sp. DIB 104C]